MESGKIYFWIIAKHFQFFLKINSGFIQSFLFKTFMILWWIRALFGQTFFILFFFVNFFDTFIMNSLTIYRNFDSTYPLLQIILLFSYNFSKTIFFVNKWDKFNLNFISFHPFWSYFIVNTDNLLFYFFFFVIW